MKRLQADPMILNDNVCQLILVYIGKKSALDAPLDEQAWAEVYSISKKQAILGIIFDAIMSLPAEQLPPRKIKLRFALVSEKIVQHYSSCDRNCASVTGYMADLGYKSCILKGQGMARLYPSPSSRQSGDIDIWVDCKSRGSLISDISKEWNVGKVFYHHADVDFFDDSQDVEVHFTPSWMNNPFANRVLQRIIEQEKPAQMTNRPENSEYCVPTISFNCFYCLIHIFRHFLFEGVGLRQFMDYYYILLHSEASDREKAMSYLRMLNMEKFTAASMYVLSKLFLLDKNHLLCQPDAKYGDMLLKEISLSGNFGRYDKRLKRSDNPIVSLFYRMSHIARFSGVARSEVLWAPYFKIKQFLWRMAKKY